MALRSFGLLLTALSVGCSLIPKNLNPTPSPLLPAQVAVSLAVLVEDLTEDPACAAQTTSWIEIADDVLSTPVTFLWSFVALQGAVWWTVVDGFSGDILQPDVRFREIARWLPLRYSGQHPSDYAQPACAGT
jgi:hypothetical protein